MGRFYDSRLTNNTTDNRNFVSVVQSNGRIEEIEVSQITYEALDDLQREYWRIERKEARHTLHLEMMAERDIPHEYHIGSPEQLLIEQVETIEIQSALQRIPTAQQKRFLLRHLVGLSLKQIAEIEGCSERAIKYSLTAAQKNLQEILMPQLPFHDTFCS